MWLGPAPQRPFYALRFHSNWRWFFDYGTGDLGNDGVHRLDYGRRGLEAALAAQGRQLPEWPTAVSASGGKLFFDDAQEFPDTLMATWEYGREALLAYEMRIWTPNALEGEEEGATRSTTRRINVISSRRSARASARLAIFRSATSRPR
jgi:hypothetical protein